LRDVAALPVGLDARAIRDAELAAAGEQEGVAALTSAADPAARSAECAAPSVGEHAGAAKLDRAELGQHVGEPARAAAAPARAVAGSAQAFGIEQQSAVDVDRAARSERCRPAFRRPGRCRP
jgi:hypothetical protein